MAPETASVRAECHLCGPASAYPCCSTCGWRDYCPCYCRDYLRTMATAPFWCPQVLCKGVIISTFIKSYHSGARVDRYRT